MDFLIHPKSFETEMIIDNFKLLKIEGSAFIYSSHVCNEHNKIYTLSIPRDIWRMRIMKTQLDMNNTSDATELKQRIFDQILNNRFVDKSNIYDFERDYHELVEHNFQHIEKTEKINQNIFYLSHSCYWYYKSDIISHILFNAYFLLGKFAQLSKVMGKLTLVVTHSHPVLNYVLDLLRSEGFDILVNKENSQLINYGNTYIGQFVTPELISTSLYTSVFIRFILKKSLKQKVILKTVPAQKIILYNNQENEILSNIDEIMKIANKFNYVPINLSNLSILEIIHLFNQATHLIIESGHLLCHLLWNLKIKSVIFVASKAPAYSASGYYINANKLFKESSLDYINDLVSVSKPKIVHDQFENLLENYPISLSFRSKENKQFNNLTMLETALKDNEHLNKSNNIVTYHNLSSITNPFVGNTIPAH